MTQVDIIMEDIFNSVKGLVLKGNTIEQACKKLNVNRANLYKKLTDLHKQDLRHAKTQFLSGAFSNRNYQVKSKFNKFEINNEEPFN